MCCSYTHLCSLFLSYAPIYIYSVMGSHTVIHRATVLSLVPRVSDEAAQSHMTTSRYAVNFALPNMYTVLHTS